MPHMDEISLSIGRLQGSISVGFQEVHRRMDIRDRYTADRHRDVMGRIHRLEYRLERKPKSGAWTVPYAKIATILGLIILGALGHIAPDAVRSAISKILLSQVGAG